MSSRVLRALSSTEYYHFRSMYLATGAHCRADPVDRLWVECYRSSVLEWRVLLSSGSDLGGSGKCLRNRVSLRPASRSMVGTYARPGICITSRSRPYRSVFDRPTQSLARLLHVPAQAEGVCRPIRWRASDGKLAPGRPSRETNPLLR